MTGSPIALYETYFVDRDYERFDLFQRLADAYGVRSALYPGSFVHITPAFVYPVTTFVDTDKQAKKFFASKQVMDFIAERKVYAEDPRVTFYAADYRTPMDEPDESYDLLISQYAGFVSQHGKRYLKIGGILLVNNSHGDASMAFIDDDYAFIAAVIRRDGGHRVTDENLDTYFVPKKPIEVTKTYLEQTQKGIGYKKTASSYLFRRVS